MFTLFPTINKYRKPVSIPNPVDMRAAALEAKRKIQATAFSSVLNTIKLAAEEGETVTSIPAFRANLLTDHHIGMLNAAGYKTQIYVGGILNISWK